MDILRSRCTLLQNTAIKDLKVVVLTDLFCNQNSRKPPSTSATVADHLRGILEPLEFLKAQNLHLDYQITHRSLPPIERPRKREEMANNLTDDELSDAPMSRPISLFAMLRDHLRHEWKAEVAWFFMFHYNRMSLELREQFPLRKILRTSIVMTRILQISIKDDQFHHMSRPQKGPRVAEFQRYVERAEWILTLLERELAFVWSTIEVGGQDPTLPSGWWQDLDVDYEYDEQHRRYLATLWDEAQRMAFGYPARLISLSTGVVPPNPFPFPLTNSSIQ
ncbi:MAG: hypothetical protein M1820_002657 [Bogoriella megaspora]|nr:MAG: hypothetical protein M1820_002657 [Bogoriella megaspora]